MGLLDDAIREHLELKRLHGADPSEVAREEHAALGLPRRGEEDPEGAEVEDAVDPEGPVNFDESRDPDEPLARGEADRWKDDSSAGPDPSQMNQETMELDMRSVLDADSSEDKARPEEFDSDPWAASSEPSLTSAEPRDMESDVGVDPLQWELRANRRGPGPHPMHGRDRGGALSVEGSLP